MTVASTGNRGGRKWRVLDHPMLFWCVIAGTLICMFRFTFIVGGEVYRGDLLIGSATAVSIAHLGIRTRARSLIVRILESPPLVWLGTISYSLYLIHFPLLPLFIGSVRSSSNRSPDVRFATAIVTGVAGSLIVSYVFHRLFERPWMTLHTKSPNAAAVAAVAQPAP